MAEDQDINQFALPHGLGGRLAGWMMTLGNADMERAAVRALAPSDDDAVLEIGFGPGVGIRMLAKRVARGHVAGVDPSTVMLQQATRRNHARIAQGRVDLRLGTATALAWSDDSFDGVMSVNNIQEWPNIESDLREIARVLKPAGSLVIAVHRWVDKYAKDRGDPAQCWAEHIAACLDRTNLGTVRSWSKRARSGTTLYFSATAPNREPT